MTISGEGRTWCRASQGMRCDVWTGTDLFEVCYRLLELASVGMAASYRRRTKNK